MKKTMTIDQTISLIKRYYEQAMTEPLAKRIKKPLAWALYQAWREVDREEGER